MAMASTESTIQQLSNKLRTMDTSICRLYQNAITSEEKTSGSQHRAKQKGSYKCIKICLTHSRIHFILINSTWDSSQEVGRPEAGKGTLVVGSLEPVPVVVGSHKAGHMLAAVRHMPVVVRHNWQAAGLVGLCETSVELVAQPSHRVDRICHPSCPALPCVASACCQPVFDQNFIDSPIFSISFLG